MSSATTTTRAWSAARSRFARGAHGDAWKASPETPQLAPAATRRQSAQARLRPGRQGVQRIYRMATEKSQINVYEYLESIGVPRVNALQVQSQAAEWFEYENAKAGGASDAPFGVEEMSEVVEFLQSKGVDAGDIGALVCKHPPVLAYSVESRIVPMFAYLAELGLDESEVVANLTLRPSLLGLDPDENMRKMVDYLISTGNTQEEALKYLLKTL